jgi:single-strand DNA-binding protein
MANDLNKVFEIGNLTRDIELSFLQNGTPKGNVSIAVNRGKKSADGQWVEEASYFDVLIWGQPAQNLQQYLTKGKKIAVCGYLKQDRWQDQQTGQNRSRIYIVAEDVQLLGGQQNGQQSNGYSQQPVQQATAYNQSAVQQPQQYQQRPQQTAPQNYPQQSYVPPADGGFPEEIPF